MTDDSRAEKSATYWYLEASNVSPVEKCTSECTEETSGLKSCADVGNIDAESPLQSLHQKRSCEPNKLNSRSKDVSTSGQSFNVHSAPGTPPISERSVKRMQSQEDSSNKKLQLSMSKKTRWSEKVNFPLPTLNAAELLKEHEEQNSVAGLKFFSRRDQMCVAIIC